jgi:hypothetical protein
MFSLPPLLGLAMGSYLLWLEYHTQYAARRIGTYLMTQNADRQARGAVWQGILASRRTRLALEDSLAEWKVEPQRAPAPVLRNRYHLQLQGPYAAFLRVEERAQPLAYTNERMDRETLRELAHSLQIYEQGRQLLSLAIMPRDPLRIHALIGAQIALEGEALFARLHERLLAQNAPEAWTFLRMDGEEQAFWRTHLAPLLSTKPDSSSTEVTPAVRLALGQILQSWEDSLHHGEVDRLQAAWEDMPGFALRLARSGDAFSAYALFPDETPTPFALPTTAVEQHLGLAAEEDMR